MWDEEEGEMGRQERREGRSDEEPCLSVNKKKMKKLRKKIEKVAKGRIVDHSVLFFLIFVVPPGP